MNETRKQIIELIETYMSKEVEFGCIVDTGKTLLTVSGKRKDFYEINIKGEQEYREATIFSTGKKTCELHGDFNNSDYTVIGHYDITAVLKYIDNNLTYATCDTSNAGLYIAYYKVENPKADIGEQGYKTLASIPNKPLSLYTEEEEKDLLELLKKLG